MAQPDRPGPDQQKLYCRACKEEFVAYRSDQTPQCPRCGRTTRVPLHRHWLRLVAVAILIGVFAIILAAFLRHL